MGLDNNCNGDRSVLGYHYKVHKLIDREKTEAGEGLYFWSVRAGLFASNVQKSEICDFVVQNKVASQEGAAVRNGKTLESGKLKLVPNAYINPIYSKSRI